MSVFNPFRVPFLPPALSRGLVAIALAAFLSLLKLSAATALETESQGWFLNTARGTLVGRWKLHLEAQPRVSGSGIRQLLIRPAIGYQLIEPWSLWLGYAWTPSFDPDKNENRIFQQSLVQTPCEPLGLTFTNRTRLEERWIENASGVSIRLRHMLRATYPLDAAGRWSLAAYDEPFVTLNEPSGGPLSGFDQNRAFLGVNRKLGAHVSVEVGYLNQFVDAKPDVVRHIGVLALDYTW